MPAMPSTPNAHTIKPYEGTSSAAVRYEFSIEAKSAPCTPNVTTFTANAAAATIVSTRPIRPSTGS